MRKAKGARHTVSHGARRVVSEANCLGKQMVKLSAARRKRQVRTCFSPTPYFCLHVWVLVELVPLWQSATIASADLTALKPGIPLRFIVSVSWAHVRLQILAGAGWVDVVGPVHAESEGICTNLFLASFSQAVPRPPPGKWLATWPGTSIDF